MSYKLLVFYVLGDTSGLWFGSAVVDNSGIWYKAGTWAKHWKEEYLNFQKADNLTQRIETLVKADKIQGQEIFLFTDNLVFESTRVIQNQKSLQI